MVPIIAVSRSQILKTSAKSTSSLRSISSVNNEFNRELMVQPNYFQKTTDLNSKRSRPQKKYTVAYNQLDNYLCEYEDEKNTFEKRNLAALEINEELRSSGEEGEQIWLRYAVLENNRLQDFDCSNNNLEVKDHVSESESIQSLSLSINMEGDYDDTLDDLKDIDRSISKASFSSDSGISTMYTSTPKKLTCQEFSKTVANTSQLENQPGLSLVQTSSTKNSPYDQSLAQILESGDEEFRSKYSSWVTELFHLQLTKMHRRLTHYFQKKIQTLDQEKEEKFQETARKDKEKLMKLESRVEKYQNVAETLRQENRKLKSTVEAVVEEMSKVAEQTKINFQAELDQHVNNIRADCENQKLQLQQQHAQQLKIFLDKSCGQIEKVEKEYHAQVVSLNHLVEDLRFQNDALEEQFKNHKRMNELPHALRPPQTSGSYHFQKEKELLLSAIQDLKNKLYAAEKDKLSLSASFGDRIEVLKSSLTSMEKNYIIKLEDSHKDFQLLQLERDKEISLLKAQLAKQAQESQDIINGLRNNYGTKIQSLSDMVENLQIDIDQQAQKESHNLR